MGEHPLGGPPLAGENSLDFTNPGNYRGYFRRQSFCGEARPGDGVLVAGKGHEDYQILGTEKIHFDEREEARKSLGDRIKIKS